MAPAGADNSRDASPPPLRDIPLHPRARELFLGPFPSEQVLITYDLFGE